MDASLAISLTALIVSLGSLGWAIHIGQRDAAKLKAESELHYDTDGSIFIRVRVVNAGRRPIMLTYLSAFLVDGNHVGEYFKEEPIRLDEHEMIEKDLYPNSIILEDIKSKNFPVNLFVEDTIGRRHKVKESRKYLSELRKELSSNSALKRARQKRAHHLA
jgi:hypothetical protein